MLTLRLLCAARYKLLQFHFHGGSETVVNGRRFPLEAQFVHQDTYGNYLVVAVLFDIGEWHPWIGGYCTATGQ